MKITKARLKEIIQEELMREHGEEEGMLAPEEYAAQRQGAGDEMRARIAQSQGSRGHDPDHLPRLKDKLIDLYRHYYDDPERAPLNLINAIEALELEIQDLEI